DERRVALRIMGVHVGTVVEQLADGLLVRISDRRDQLGNNRPCLTPLVAGANRGRRISWGLGHARGEQNNRDPDAREQGDRDSDGSETHVTLPTTHKATPIQDGKRSVLASGATTPPHLNPLLMRNGKGGRSAVS